MNQTRLIFPNLKSTNKQKRKITSLSLCSANLSSCPSSFNQPLCGSRRDVTHEHIIGHCSKTREHSGGCSGREGEQTLLFCALRDQRNYSQEVRNERSCSSIRGLCHRVSLSNMMQPPICRGVNVAKQTK